MRLAKQRTIAANPRPVCRCSKCKAGSCSLMKSGVEIRMAEPLQTRRNKNFGQKAVEIEQEKLLAEGSRKRRTRGTTVAERHSFSERERNRTTRGRKDSEIGQIQTNGVRSYRFRATADDGTCSSIDATTSDGTTCSSIDDAMDLDQRCGKTARTSKMLTWTAVEDEDEEDGLLCVDDHDHPMVLYYITSFFFHHCSEFHSPRRSSLIFQFRNLCRTDRRHPRSYKKNMERMTTPLSLWRNRIPR